MATEITTPTAALISFLHRVQELGVGADSTIDMKGRNPYKYVSLPKLLGQVHTAARDNGFAYSNVVGINDGFMTITHILIHESGRYEQEYIGPKVPTASGTQGNQAWGATRTYAVRTTLMSFCGVHHDPDWDGDWMSPDARDKAIEAPSTPDPFAGTGQWTVDPLNGTLGEVGAWETPRSRLVALAEILTDKLPQWSSTSYTGQDREEMQQFLTSNEALWPTLPPTMIANIKERAAHIGLTYGG